MNGARPSRYESGTTWPRSPADLRRTAERGVHESPGDEAAVRRRSQLLAGEPVVLSTSYYPMWIAEATRLELPEAIPEGLMN